MSAFSEAEQQRLRHFLGILLAIEEPEALLGVLERIAEHKALRAINGSMTDKDSGLRWYNLAIALEKVQQELRGVRHARTSTRSDGAAGWDGDRSVCDAELYDPISTEDAGE